MIFPAAVRPGAACARMLDEGPAVEGRTKADVRAAPVAAIGGLPEIAL